MVIYSTALNSFTQYYDIDGAFSKMKGIGYGACDINLDLRKSVMASTDKQRLCFLRSILKSAKKNNIKIGQTHGGFFFDTDCFDRTYISKYIELKKEEIQITAALECQYLVVHPLFFYGWGKNINPEHTKSVNAEILKELCTYAKSYGVHIALENMPGVPNHDISCSTAHDLMSHINAVDMSNICACLDFGHANISIKNKISPDETLLTQYMDILGERIKCVHIHDNTGIEDMHALPLSPRGGGIEWDKAVSALKQIKYKGTFNAEIHFANRYLKNLFLPCEIFQFAVLKEIAKPLYEDSL